MSTLVLLRHGQSQWNLENRFTGFKDPDLTDLGVEEAQKAGAQLKAQGIAFDAVFTSTLKRARRTAELVLNAAGQGHLIASMIAHDDLRERDYGDLTGLNKDETKAKYGEAQVHIWRRSYDIPPPGGESLKDVLEKRVRPYFKAQIKPLLDQGKNVLIAAHGNSLRALLIELGEATSENVNEYELATGVPVVLKV
ncbi:MAG: 2,3-bisphosphoglycerate-dependent phosphoglycerate mutase [Alphaproteobacteria bacterium]|nr:2,3-bisphosphoglycerate-dependent phosphoglycerate mutase [Alphaproteobacteria bacterium]